MCAAIVADRGFSVLLESPRMHMVQIYEERWLFKEGMRCTVMLHESTRLNMSVALQ